MFKEMIVRHLYKLSEWESNGSLVSAKVGNVPRSPSNSGDTISYFDVSPLFWSDHGKKVLSIVVPSPRIPVSAHAIRRRAAIMAAANKQSHMILSITCHSSYITSFIS